MTPAAPDTLPEIEVFRYQARIIHGTVRVNLDGLTHEDSLIQPEPAGNCLNWVLGHLVATYENLLPLLGRERVTEKGALERYARGSPPLTDPEQALPLDDLTAAWTESSKRVNEGLQGLGEDALDEPAPTSPTDNPDETVRSLLAMTFFHQSYHAGQTGLLRRLAGKEGAIP